MLYESEILSSTMKGEHRIKLLGNELFKKNLLVQRTRDEVGINFRNKSSSSYHLVLVKATINNFMSPLFSVDLPGATCHVLSGEKV